MKFEVDVEQFLSDLPRLGSSPSLAQGVENSDARERFTQPN
jgi:hypothetical protein